MIVVSDTSPLTNLIQIQRLSILKDIFGNVVITPSVYKELCVIPEQQKVLAEQNWIHVKESADKQMVHHLEKNLDKGEAESISLAIELQADYLLIDEWKGREIAEGFGLRIVGLLGILIKAKASGLIEHVKPVLDQLINEAGFFIHNSLYNKIVELAKEEKL